MKETGLQCDELTKREIMLRKDITTVVSCRPEENSRTGVPFKCVLW